MISTRLTERFGLSHPIIQAPMAVAAGGRLAASVSEAGALGLIGGGYGDPDWLGEQFDIAGDQSVGCGLITWALAKNPSLLDVVLARDPRAVFLSFGDPQEYMPVVKCAGVPVICQVQTLRDAQHAADHGADVVVAQGSEAGGHGEKRATFTLVPEVADYLARAHPDVLLCAAGGIGDGRGLAAALMLGADGVVIGSRFWASREALVHPNMHDAALGATGDETIRSSVMDRVRSLEWPQRYTARVLKNEFTEKWHDDPDGLMRNAVEESANWKAAWAAGDVSVANAFVGEVAGLFTEIPTAGEVVDSIVTEAEALLRSDRWESRST